MQSYLAAAFLLLLPVLTLAQPQRSAEVELIERINALRAQPSQCRGKQHAVAKPLTLNPALSRAAPRAMNDARTALQREGYQSARVEVLTVSGATSASAALQVLQQHCAVLLDRALLDIGVQRQGDQWAVVLARPLLDAALGDWHSAGQQMLALVNKARAQPRRCGQRAFAAAPPLSWNEALAAAALAHSRDMARHDHFDHTGTDGSDVAVRAQRQSYAYRIVGENIAAGSGSAQRAVDGWLKSPGHCENLMNPQFKHMGAAYAEAPQSQYGIFWTQVFGAVR